MQSSVFLAKLIGPILVLVAVGALVNAKQYQRVMEDFAKSAALWYLAAYIALVSGLLVVLVHNVWAPEWVVIITIMGWIGVLKGAMLLIFPNFFLRFSGAFTKSTTPLKAQSAIILVLGAFLIYKGYLG